MSPEELSQHMRFHHGYDQVQVFSQPVTTLQVEHKKIHQNSAIRCDHTHAEENE